MITQADLCMDMVENGSMPASYTLGIDSHFCQPMPVTVIVDFFSCLFLAFASVFPETK